jgi:hypothetical protein
VTGERREAIARHPLLQGTVGAVLAAIVSALLSSVTVIVFVRSGNAPEAFTGSPRTVTVSVPPATVTVTASPTSPSPQPPSQSPGTVLGEYDVELTDGYGFNIASTQPRQNDFQQPNGPSLDLSYRLVYGSRAKMVLLPAGTSPTYERCTSGTAFVVATPVVSQGTNICILKADSTIVGITTKDVKVNSGTPSVATIHVVAWANPH